MNPMRQPVVADRYFVTWEELGKPITPGNYPIPGLGELVFDDTDLHYALTGKATGFFVRKSAALHGRYVVVSRQQSA